MLGVAVGFDASGDYKRKQASFDPRVGFIFEGIAEDEVIGDFGLSGGGASGGQIDAVNATRAGVLGNVQKPLCEVDFWPRRTSLAVPNRASRLAGPNRPHDAPACMDPKTESAER